MPNTLVLASTSPYRKALLARLGLPFTVAASATDESALDGEDPAALARRLARAKSAAIAAARPDALVIGADQVAVCRGTVVGKPGSHAAARAQLQASAGKEMAFLTAVCLQPPGGAAPLAHLDVTRVVFRPLDEATIERYLATEKPYDCAGSFKAEGLGISLFEHIDARDPTGLIGLPLIWLAGALRAHGLIVP